MSGMRAKLKIIDIQNHDDGSESLRLAAVCRREGYPDDGSDEDNTFARFTPQADLDITIANPSLCGTFSVGTVFYVDFTKVEE